MHVWVYGCLSVSEMHTTTATRLLPLLPSLLKKNDNIVLKSEFTGLSVSDKYSTAQVKEPIFFFISRSKPLRVKKFYSKLCARYSEDIQRTSVYP